MPTAANYEWWAGWFGQQAATMAGLLGEGTSLATPDALVGGTLAATVDIAVSASARNALTIADNLAALAEECGRRAEVRRGPPRSSSSKTWT